MSKSIVNQAFHPIATRRTVLASAGMAVAAVLCASPALAQQASNYPNKPVRMIVGFPAGTGPDVVARLLAQKLSEGWSNLGVIVDNKPGAAGLIAASEAARAPADGYTIMLAETGQLSIAPSTYRKLAYNPPKDFVPVSQVVSSDNDSAVSALRAMEMARNWGAEIGILSGAGHINVKSGHQRWEQGFAYLYRLQGRIEQLARRRA